MGKYILIICINISKHLLQIKSREGPSFKTKNELFSWIEWLPGGPRWKCEEIELVGYDSTPIHLIYRDALEVTKHLFANPIFAQHMSFNPKEVNICGEREYSKFFTGEEAFRIQVHYSIPHLFKFI